MLEHLRFAQLYTYYIYKNYLSILKRFRLDNCSA